MLVNVVGGAAVENRIVIRKQQRREGAQQSVVDELAAAAKFTESREGRHGQVPSRQTDAASNHLPITFLLFSPSVYTSTEPFVCTVSQEINPVIEDSRSELRSTCVTSLPFRQESCLGCLRVPPSHRHLLATTRLTRWLGSTRLHVSAVLLFSFSLRRSVNSGSQACYISQRRQKAKAGAEKN